MTVTIACERCNRMFAYPSRRHIKNLCPECEMGPFDSWYFEVATADD